MKGLPVYHVVVDQFCVGRQKIKVEDILKISSREYAALIVTWQEGHVKA